MFVYTNVFLNTCWIHIMLLVCLFSWLNVQHWATTCCDLSCRELPLALPALLSSLLFFVGDWDLLGSSPIQSGMFLGVIIVQLTFLFSFLDSIFLPYTLCFIECSLSFEISVLLNCFWHMWMISFVKQKGFNSIYSYSLISCAIEVLYSKFLPIPAI